MLKLLLGTLLAGLVIGCAMEESGSGTLTLDPNRGEAPEGVTIQDVDHVKDGVIDIRDLVAVAYFHGQTVDETEELVAEACPAGLYRETVPKVVGYHKDWDEEIPTDSSGRRLEERHKESCAYQYPNWRQFDTCVGYNYGRCREGGWASKGPPPDKTCLVACAQGSSALCSQTEKMYSSCKRCPKTKDVGNRIRYAEYIQSDDPTKCQRGEKVNIQYRFAYGDDFYVYALVYMGAAAYFDIASEKAGARFKGPRSLIVAVRILVSADGKIAKEIKAKTLISDPNKDIRRDQPEIREVFTAYDMKRKNHDYLNNEIMFGSLFIDQEGKENVFVKIQRYGYEVGYTGNSGGGVRYDVSVTYPGQTTIRHDSANVYIGHLLEKSEPTTEENLRMKSGGIPIGNPSKINADFPESYIYSISFLDQYLKDQNQNYTGIYTWDASTAWSDARLMFPEEVRAKYFPEDIEE